MSRFIFILISVFSLFLQDSFAIQIREATVIEKNDSITASSFDAIIELGKFLIDILLFIIVFWLLIKVIRLIYEVLMAGNLVSMKVTLPRADSKLDKERETKKDFKEKVGIMSIFYKSVHNLTQASAWDTIMNFIFRHAKISLELMYHEGMVHFYAV